MAKMPIEVQPQTTRPYRHFFKDYGLPGRNYSDPVRCLDGAIKFLQWQQINTTVECWNVQEGKMLGWYKRHASGTITFWRNLNA